jgi:hypothetical protein
MNLARTPPDVAVSNLSLWVGKIGFHKIPIPSWLRDRQADEIGYRWSKRALGALVIVGLIAGAIYFAPTMKPVFTPTSPAPPTSAAQHPSSPLPPIPYSDNEVHGWLEPAGDPTPPNGCDRIPPNILPVSDAIKILIGDNAVAKTGFGKTVALQIGKCEAVSIERTTDGVFVNAEVFDKDGEEPIRITKNEIFSLNGENYSSRRSRDSSTITVKDNNGEIIFYARFINPTTVKIRGTFGCSGHPAIIVRDDEPIPGVITHGMCSVDSRMGIFIN